MAIFITVTDNNEQTETIKPSKDQSSNNILQELHINIWKNNNNSYVLVDFQATLLMALQGNGP